MGAVEMTGAAKPNGIAKLLSTGARSGGLYLVAAFLVFAAMLTAALRSYRAIDRDLTEAALSRNAAIAELGAVTLSEKLDRLVDIGVSLADRVRFRELIAAGRWNEAIRILDRVRNEFPFVDRVTLNDIDSTLRADIPEVPEVLGRNFADRDWYKGVTREWTPYVSNVYRRAAAPAINVFTVTVPIRSRDGKAIGILLLQVKLDTLLEWTGRVDIGEKGYLYVVDRTGRAAFHPRFPPQGKPVDLSALPPVRMALDGKKGAVVAAGTAGGADQVVAYEPVPKYGWAVIAEQPASHAFAARDQQLKRLLLAYSLVALFSILAVYLASQVIIERKRADEDRRIKTELERRVAERTAQLEAANKELESFGYSVSHDLRSPLRAIDGFVRILEEDYNERLDDEGRRLIGVVRENSRKMGKLIDDLLAFSRLGRKPLSVTRIDMNRLLEDALEEVGETNGTLPELKFGNLPAGLGDPMLLKQVWLNLLSNAVKFSGKREQPAVEVTGNENGEECVYCVKDNGAGFDMRYYDKLFGVFQRLHKVEEFNGTGVGLAIVQRVVSRHGGRVWAEGKVGEGAAFYFSLPKESGDGQVQ